MATKFSAWKLKISYDGTWYEEITFVQQNPNIVASYFKGACVVALNSLLVNVM